MRGQRLLRLHGTGMSSAASLRFLFPSALAISPDGHGIDEFSLEPSSGPMQWQTQRRAAVFPCVRFRPHVPYSNVCTMCSSLIVSPPLFQLWYQCLPNLRDVRILLMDLFALAFILSFKLASNLITSKLSSSLVGCSETSRCCLRNCVCAKGFVAFLISPT